MADAVQPPSKSPSSPSDEAAGQNASSPGPDVVDEDFYFDGPYLVFTASYHRKRGYCCNSGCRHCPYQ